MRYLAVVKRLRNYAYMAWRLNTRQVVHRLRSQVYFALLNRWPRLQWPIQALRDEHLDRLFSFPDRTQARLARACRDGEFEVAYELIMETLRLRKTPRFYFVRSDRSHYNQVAREALTRQRQQAIVKAGRYLDGWWPLNEENEHPIIPGTNWWDLNPPGNIEYAVRLHSCRDLIHLGRAYWYTDDDHFARRCIDLVQDWIARHPVGRLPAWKPMAASMRALTWSWLFEQLLDVEALSAAEVVTWLKSTYQHGIFLERHLEFDHANNHLLFNLVGLLVLALTFPEFRPAGRWRQLACRHLREQVPQLVCPDGVYGERSSYYHMIVTDLLLQAVVLLRHNDLSLGDEVDALVERMADFCLHVRHPDGSLPMLSDSYLENDLCNLEDVLATAGLVFERTDLLAATSGPSERAFWLLGQEAIEAYKKRQPPATLSSRAFAHGGYYILRSGCGNDALYALVDCGAFGLRRNPAHGHCDALSLELFALGHPMLVDPGVFEYEDGQWRRFFRGTSAHNTVMVDGQEQSEVWGHMRVGRMARAICHQWLSTSRFDFFDGSHDGYMRLSDPVIHRRQIFYLKGDYLIVCDHLIAHRSHQIDTFYHFPPGTHISVNETGCSLTADFDNAHLAVFPVDDTLPVLVAGQTDPPQGWVSYANGAKLPAPVIHWRRICAGCTSFGLLLYPYRADCTVNSFNRISQSDMFLGAKVLRIGGNEWVFSSPVPQVFHLRKDLSGHAKFLWLRHRASSLTSAFVGISVSSVRFDGRLVLECSQPVSWLDVRYGGGAVRLTHGEQQPFTVRLWAPGVADVVVNGNHVECSCNAGEIKFACGR
jgi:uncharacterized heparinase superfamily protein